MSQGEASYVGLTANEIIQKFKKGSIRREFPTEYLEVKYEDIETDAKAGKASARKAKKLLCDGREDWNK